LREIFSDLGRLSQSVLFSWPLKENQGIKKYIFKPYSRSFPNLFEQEKARITHACFTCPVQVEHVGSTAIEGLGGKGIIDLAVIVEEKDRETAREKLQALGYEFKPSFSTQGRLFLLADLPDSEERVRRYHIHLIYPQSQEQRDLIGFRDYLRRHPAIV